MSLPLTLKCSISMLLSVNAVRLSWDNNGNWGDNLNPYLVRKISGKRIARVPYGCRGGHHVIGSVLQKLNYNSIVWGAGFISDNATSLRRPRKVLAVRGPKSARIFLRNGISCPEVFGDPAILLPWFYDPAVVKKYRVGIVPHYSHRSHIDMQGLAELPGVTIIDVGDKTEHFIDRILECESILSSSLHGLICADAYRIPNAQFVCGSQLTGGQFKFDDYRLGVNGSPYSPLELAAFGPQLESLDAYLSIANLTSAREAIWECCPFRTDGVSLKATTS